MARVHLQTRVRRRAIRNPLNEGRGSNPGDTPVITKISLEAYNPLNEGRGSNPGDTIDCRDPVEAKLLLRRSTKAGVRIPATLWWQLTGSAIVRSAPAQRRPGFESRRHLVRRREAIDVWPPAVAQRRPGFESRRHS